MTDNSVARISSDDERRVFDRFKQLVENVEGLQCPMDEEYLLRFLRAKKLDSERALESLTSWWKTRDTMPHCHDGLFPSVYEEVYKKGFSTTFAHRDSHGRQIIVWRPGKWNPKETPFLQIFRSNYPILDTIAMRQETQLHGAVFVVDLTGLGLSHVTALGPSSMKILWYLTDGMPLRIKGIHFVNHNSLFNAVYTCAKAFMKEKMKKRVHFHGFNYSSLHKFIDPKILPTTYGGLLSEEEFQEANFTKTVLERDAYFKDLFTIYGYNRGQPNKK